MYDYFSFKKRREKYGPSQINSIPVYAARFSIAPVLLAFIYSTEEKTKLSLLMIIKGFRKKTEKFGKALKNLTSLFQVLKDFH